ncbi:MAG: PIN domain-containing protein [Limisphaerales bacterium]
MSKLLKGKRVFVDTQVFREARFAVSNPAFAKLRELCEARKLTLLTTDITRREINANIVEVASEIQKTLRKAAGIITSLGQPDIIVFGIPTNKLTEDDLVKALAKQVNDYFEKCQVEQVELPRTTLATVIDLYFKKQPPFSDKKKSEFPDAFVLEALKSKAGINDEIVYVVSKDPDLANACKQHPYLECIETLPHFLDRYNAHADTINQVHATVKKNFKQIEKQLQDILESLPGELQDRSGFVQLNSVQLADILDTLVVSCDGPTASVGFVCHVEVKASLKVTDSTDAHSDFREIDQMEVVNITLEFKFDPANADVFEVETYWAPTSLCF